MTKPKTVLVLRTCASNRTSHEGFTWPESGPIECPDWKPTAECGNGLHGCLWGEGDGTLLDWSPDARWLVVEVRASEVVDLAGKVKFPRGVVVHCGDRLSATSFLAAHGAAGRAIIGGTATAGHGGTATAGYYGTATAGDGGTASAGHGGTATAGHGGTVQIKRWDGTRYRIVTGYIGENGLLPDTPYRIDGAGKFVQVTP